MGLSEAEKTFIAAYAVCNQGDKGAVVELYRASFGVGEEAASGRAILSRVARLMKRQEAQAVADNARAVAGQKRVEGVANVTRAVFERVAALEELEQAAIEEVTSALRDGGVSGAAKAKLADAAVKLLGRQASAPTVSPELAKARRERIEQLQEQREALRRREAAEGGDLPSPVMILPVTRGGADA